MCAGLWELSRITSVFVGRAVWNNKTRFYCLVVFVHFLCHILYVLALPLGKTILDMIHFIQQTPRVILGKDEWYVDSVVWISFGIWSVTVWSAENDDGNMCLIICHVKVFSMHLWYFFSKHLTDRQQLLWKKSEVGELCFPIWVLLVLVDASTHTAHCQRVSCSVYI